MKCKRATWRCPSLSWAWSVYGLPCAVPPDQLFTSFWSEHHLLFAAPQVHPREERRWPPGGAQAWDWADGPRWPLPLRNEQVWAGIVAGGAGCGRAKGEAGAGSWVWWGVLLVTYRTLSAGSTTTSSGCRPCSSRRSSRSGWLRPSPKWKVWLRVWRSPLVGVTEQGRGKLLSYSWSRHKKTKVKGKIWNYDYGRYMHLFILDTCQTHVPYADSLRWGTWWHLPQLGTEIRHRWWC